MSNILYDITDPVGYLLWMGREAEQHAERSRTKIHERIERSRAGALRDAAEIADMANRSTIEGVPVENRGWKTLAAERSSNA